MSYEERLKRQESNEQRVLTFLASEGVSTASMLSELLGYQQPQSVYKILRRLQEKNLLRTRKIDFIGNLYLLTQSAISRLDPDVKVKVVNPSEIHHLSINHRLAIQKCHIMMIKNNIQWTSSSGRAKKGKQKPDGIIWFHDRHEEKTQIAIEVELTVKTKLRYKEIYNAYCTMSYETVLYIVPNKIMEKRITAIFKEIILKDVRPVGYGFRGKVSVQVFTTDAFGRIFTEQGSEMRREKIRQMMEKEKEAKRKAAEQKALPQKQAEAEKEPLTGQQVSQEEPAEPPKKKWGLF
jgi:hypothetical protein